MRGARMSLRSSGLQPISEWFGAANVSALYQDRPSAVRPPAFANDAERFGDFGIGFHQPAEVAAEAVLVELLVRLDVPKAAGIRGKLVRHHDAHEVVFPQPPGLH